MSIITAPTQSSVGRFGWPLLYAVVATQTVLLVGELLGRRRSGRF